MKISSLIKFFGCGVLIAGGVTAAVEFSNLNTKKFPTVRILTKESFNSIKSAQSDPNNKVINKGVDINYYTLSGSNYSTLDIVKGIKRNYMFFFGSEAYLETTKPLYGWDKPYASGQGAPIQYSNSLMQNLYDLFLTQNQEAIDFGIQNVDPIFLSYIDICSTKEIKTNEQIFYDRFLNMGDRNYNGSEDKSPDHSREWIVNADDSQKTQYVPVISGAASYNYAPEPATYQFRPNNLPDTQYETIYFRDQTIVKNYNDIGDFFTNYLSQNYGISFNKKGTLLCVKYENNNWSFKTLTGFGDVKNDVIDIVKFYNPQYEDNSENDESSNDTSEPSTSPSTKIVMNNNLINHIRNNIKQHEGIINNKYLILENKNKKKLISLFGVDKSK